LAAHERKKGRPVKGLALATALVSATASCLGALAAGGAGAHSSTMLPLASVAVAGGSRPIEWRPPRISGTARAGLRLTASHGSWRHGPRSYAYRWKRCNSKGRSCKAISGARSRSYTLRTPDIGARLRVSVTASNAAGRSRPATSAPTAVVTGSSSVRVPGVQVPGVQQPGVQHLEYVFVDGLVSVYDMDEGQKLIKTIPLPQTDAGIRGVTVAPSTHMLFVSYGGDGGGNGNGSVLAYDLVAEKVVWAVHLSSGIDSGAVSPDGRRLYMPTGENTSSGIWNILDTSSGALIGTIQGGAGAHNTIASNDGRYVYLGGRNHNYLEVYETSTGQVRSIGPLQSGVRPFTVNASNTLAFTTATEFDGFQVSSITTGKVLFTVSFGSVPKGFPFSAPSHGASLSPDEKQLYVIDAVNKEVRVYDVSRVSEGVAPTQIGVVPVAGLSGTESPCAYDCPQDGWLQHSLDGRFVYVGDSGEVIDTATRKVLTTLPALANTRKSLEIDWQNGVPIATGGRTGVGYVG
jgi:WD40 repeat protein